MADYPELRWTRVDDDYERRLALLLGRLDVDRPEYDPSLISTVTRRLVAPGSCRGCGDPSWLADDDGPVHPCCKAWHAEGTRCPGCKESRKAWREYEERGRRNR